MASMTIPSPIGPLILTSAAGRLTGVAFVGRWSPTGITAAALPPPPPHDAAADTDPVLIEAARQLAEYFRGDRTEFGLPLAPQGDAFHLGVWQRIAEIPMDGQLPTGRSPPSSAVSVCRRRSGAPPEAIRWRWWFRATGWSAATDR